MVASIDGSTVIDSNSRGLSSKTDQEVLLTLRELADVLIVGAATVRIEGYGPPRKPGQRVGVVSRRGDVDATSPLFTSGAGFLILPDDAPPTSDRFGTRRNRRGRSRRVRWPSSTPTSCRRRAERMLNGALSAADRDRRAQPDHLAAARRRRRATGHQRQCPVSRRMRLAHVLEDDGFLFTRYLRAR